MAMMIPLDHTEALLPGIGAIKDLYGPWVHQEPACPIGPQHLEWAPWVVQCNRLVL